MDKDQPQHLSRGGFLKFTARAAVAAFLGALGLWEYAVFESVWFKRTRITLPITGLPAAFEGAVIAHLTDLHFNDWTTPDRFGEVVDMVNDHNPDIIAITGDFIDGRTSLDQIPEIITQLRRLRAREGIFAVLGNHDYWRDAGLVRQMLEQSGIRELPNRAAAVQREGELLYVCGLDNVTEDKQDLDTLLVSFPVDSCAVLLVHEPDYADVCAPTGRFDVQLSGHSHGGQVSVPFYGPPITPSFAHKYPRGMYQVGDMAVYTNTGIGMIPPLVRFNCRPEVAFLTLIGDSSAS